MSLKIIADQSEQHKHIPDLRRPLTIGGLECRNRVFLAPMSGVTDVPFRKMAWKYGAGLVFSEMVASEALVSGKAEMEIKAESAGLPIHAVQIAGREAHWMGLAARLACDNGADIIDINMGCPSRRVTSGLSGSALMRDLDHATGLIQAVVESVDVPVTLKMRLGWDATTINAPELAKRAQDIGVQMISVHGRTRCQFYKGDADWEAVRAVRDAIRIPLIVNGDISDSTSAGEALRQSGADGVMIGRASYGRPWLIGQIANAHIGAGKRPSTGEIALEHLNECLRHLSCDMAVRHYRKHLNWYLEQKDAPEMGADKKRALMTETDGAILASRIEELFLHNPNRVAA